MASAAANAAATTATTAPVTEVNLETIIAANHRIKKLMNKAHSIAHHMIQLSTLVLMIWSVREVRSAAAINAILISGLVILFVQFVVKSAFTPKRIWGPYPRAYETAYIFHGLGLFAGVYMFVYFMDHYRELHPTDGTVVTIEDTLLTGGIVTSALFIALPQLVQCLIMIYCNKRSQFAELAVQAFVPRKS